MVTFAPLNLLGVSLNIMSLGGLALGIGMLVDSSIVVLESIYRSKEEGHDLVSATVHGTKDVAGAVTASTLTTVGVFLPMVFVEGVAGQAFDDLGLAVVLSLLVSLVVALYFIPMLASRQADVAGGELPKGHGLGWVWPLRCWSAVASDWRALSRTARVLLVPYFLLKLVVNTVLELAGRAILLVVSLPRLLWGQIV